MRSLKYLTTVLIILVWSIALLADSPLTSCYFAVGYSDIPEVAQMIADRGQTQEGILLDSLTCRFLLDQNRPIDVRMALINAMGFGQSANIEILMKQMSLFYPLQQAQLQHDLATSAWVSLNKQCIAGGVGPEEMLVISYVIAMAEYSLPRCALPFAASATAALQDHETCAWITSLIVAQMIMDVDPCEVYITFAELPKKSLAVGSMRPAAKQLIMDYIILFEADCLPDEFSDSYYTQFPVYDTLQVKQTYGAAKYVDLQFEGQFEGLLPLEQSVDNANEEGGKIVVLIHNAGNTKNIVTNLYCVMYLEKDGEMERLVRQARIPPIKSNQTELVEVFLPGIWWQKGSGRMQLFIDQANQIDESNEDNNRVELSQ